MAGTVAVSVDGGNQASLGSDSSLYAYPFPLVSSTVSGILPATALSGNPTDLLDGTANAQSLVTAESSVIWSVRPRNFNALHNPNFEIDQRRYYATTSVPSGWSFPADRWSFEKNSATAVWQLSPLNLAVYAPGTNYLLSQTNPQLTVTTTQATLAATEYHFIDQYVEGPRLRELLSGPHSVSFLIYWAPNTANLPFSFFIRDNGAKWTYTKLINPGSYPSYGNWILVQLPNLSWASGGNFPVTPGSYGCNMGIGFGAGTTFIAPADGVWSSGNFLGSPGTGNFAAAGGKFALGFFQWEPGPVCTQFIDLPFDKNLRACQRFYSKSVGYAWLATSGAWRWIGTWSGNTTCRLDVRFPVEMWRTPTVVLYPNSATPNQVYIDLINGAAPVSSSNQNASGIYNATLSASQAGTAPQSILGCWSADTGY
jgi:hypothetical protein